MIAAAFDQRQGSSQTWVGEGGSGQWGCQGRGKKNINEMRKEKKNLD